MLIKHGPPTPTPAPAPASTFASWCSYWTTRNRGNGSGRGSGTDADLKIRIEREMIPSHHVIMCSLVGLHHRTSENCKHGLFGSNASRAEASEEYTRFLFLQARERQRSPAEAETLGPSSAVDDVWHAHILDTANYARFCTAVFGDFLHHNPSLQDGQYSRTQCRLPGTVREFGPVPRKWWPASKCNTEEDESDDEVEDSLLENEEDAPNYFVEYTGNDAASLKYASAHTCGVCGDHDRCKGCGMGKHMCCGCG